ncbi:MAG: SAM-dependent chlorinase/fluorinase [Cyclobacteriaceae bacterium]|nr:SAM-dependent chlorinase/fluorinase [Cyclobacteriaceae bacterium]
MTIVTFMSDFGNEDHYVATVKAALLKNNSAIRILDISHTITPFDIGHAAYVLRHAFPHFPEGSVHLVAIDPSDKIDTRIIALRLQDHYFIGSDTGIFSIISEQEPDEIIEITFSPSTFLARDVLAPVAALLATGTPLHSLGETTRTHRKLFARQPKVTKREIVGNIIRVDHFGNLITNIRRVDFDKIQELNGHVPFEVQVGRETYRRFHENYDEADPGDCYVLFNTDGLLQIGINKGHAAQLLGLRLDAPIYIQFNP